MNQIDQKKTSNEMISKVKKQSHLQLFFSYAFKGAWTNTFAPDGWDPINEEWNGETLSKESISRNSATDYYLHPLIMITSFLGLQNRMPKNEHPNLARIFKNMVGWKDKTPDKNNALRLAGNIVGFPFALVGYTVLAVFTFAHNLLKAVTEFPLAWASAFLKLEAIRSIEINSRTDSQRKGLRYYALSAVQFAFTSSHALVRAVTSPINSVRSAWKKGNKLGDELGEMLGYSEDTRKGMSATIGVIFSLASMAITATVYAFALPLIIHAAAPALMSSAPAAATFVGKSILVPFGKIIAPAFQAVGLPIATYAGAALTSIGLFAGVAMTTIGFGVTRAWAKYQNSKSLVGAVKSIAQDILPSNEKSQSSHASIKQGLGRAPNHVITSSDDDVIDHDLLNEFDPHQSDDFQQFDTGVSGVVRVARAKNQPDDTSGQTNPAAPSNASEEEPSLKSPSPSSSSSP